MAKRDPSVASIGRLVARCAPFVTLLVATSAHAEAYMTPDMFAALFGLWLLVPLIVVGAPFAALIFSKKNNRIAAGFALGGSLCGVGFVCFGVLVWGDNNRLGLLLSLGAVPALIAWRAWVRLRLQHVQPKPGDA